MAHNVYVQGTPKKYRPKKFRFKKKLHIAVTHNFAH